MQMSKGSFIRAFSKGTDRQQLELFSLKIHFRSKTEILRKKTDSYLQPNGMKITLSFGYIPFRMKSLHCPGWLKKELMFPQQHIYVK
uniref:Uncharacterized protein n=1 Tax=Romanomermis culicivorax TaxID=13658 RepID=A0A915KPU1_ROMCU